MKRRAVRFAIPIDRPWEAEGFKFSIGWPIGYQCTAADSHKGKSTIENSINAQAGRQKSAMAGKGWGTGTLPGLSKKVRPA